MLSSALGASFFSFVLASSVAQAQQPLPPLPGGAAGSTQPPPQSYPPQSYPPQSYPPAPPPYSPQIPQSAPPPPSYYSQQTGAPAPPPVYEYTEAPEPVHAPRYSLYAGASVRYLGFGGNFYRNELGAAETTGNFVKPGPALELDVGARLGKRYIPFVFWEHGFMTQGNRFEGSDASSSSDLVGIGFRYAAGDVNHTTFLSELSIGLRSITVKNGDEKYKMSGWEFFRFGLGAEIRLTNSFTLSPMAHISSGTMNDTDGDITFSPDGSKDGLKHPTSTNGRTIQDGKAYAVISIGIGAHFDLFGK